MDKCDCLSSSACRVTYPATAISWRATISRRDGSPLTVPRRRGRPPISWRSSSPRGHQAARSGDPDSRTRKLSPEDDVGACRPAESRGDGYRVLRCPAEIVHTDLQKHTRRIPVRASSTWTWRDDLSRWQAETGKSRKRCPSECEPGFQTNETRRSDVRCFLGLLGQWTVLNFPDLEN